VKKLLIVFVVLTTLVFLAGLSISYAQMGAHDMSGTFGGGEICIVCHAPHNNLGAGAGPLWNHEVTGIATFTPYSDTGGGTLQSTPGDPGPVSKLCFGCHDGITAIDDFGGGAAGSTMTGSAVIDSDLTSDHPVGFGYDTTLATADGELETPDNVAGEVGATTQLPLFGAGGDQMECATCHDVHDASLTNFLRMSNTGSLLCLNCHQK
jgi:predicted CXXCH cytochrome family protein